MTICGPIAVAATTDNACVDHGSNTIYTTYYALGDVSGAAWDVGLRFLNVTVPPGATISAAPTTNAQAGGGGGGNDAVGALGGAGGPGRIVLTWTDLATSFDPFGMSGFFGM